MDTPTPPEPGTAAPAGNYRRTVTVDLGPSRAEAVRRAAYADGLTTSIFIRQIVDREIARRTRRCPVCGQTVPATFGEEETTSASA